MIIDHEIKAERYKYQFISELCQPIDPALKQRAEDNELAAAMEAFDQKSEVSSLPASDQSNFILRKYIKGVLKNETAFSARDDPYAESKQIASMGASDHYDLQSFD